MKQFLIPALLVSMLRQLQTHCRAGAGMGLMVFFFVCRLQTGFAQQGKDSVADVSRIAFTDFIDHDIFIGMFDRDNIPDDSIPYLPITQPFPNRLRSNVSASVVEKTIYLKFALSNRSDSVRQVYFFPGVYFEKIALFRASSAATSAHLTLVTDTAVNNVTPSGFVLVRMPPGDTSLFYARLKFVRTNVNSFNPQVIRKSFINFFRNDLLLKKASINLITYLASGILLMMIFYSLGVFLQTLNVEFLYYSSYAFFIGLLLFLKSYLYESTTNFNYFFEGYLDFIIQSIALIFYFMFIRTFLDAKRNHVFLDRVLRIAEKVIIVFLVLYSIIYFSTSEFVILNFIENITKQFLLVVGLIFIIYGLRKKDALMNYLVAGQATLIVFSVISFLLIVTPLQFSGTKSSIFNDSLLFYEIGLIAELILFLSGLAYKNKKDIIERIKEQERLKLDNERKEFEKQVAVLEAKQEERNRISADMHDELGSGVTAIRLMSEIVKSKMKEQTLPEIEKISHSANELLNKMNTIIWTMISSNDSIENLVSYIRAYAVEFFENTPIDCSFNMPVFIPSKEMSGEKRRNIFLCVKEALNNALKHSQASAITIDIIITDRLIINISDNGVGINMDKLRKFGNGLHNMRKRMQSIDGEFRIEADGGTKTSFDLQL